ncbi:hypothetical protein SAMN05192574_11847 [Mucilaginibacter gossypiicola]|uniref:Uncharacterized protein n=1 Tax=Mucilaginibacter gossypiicola TaxID=551995 RepID=A0A1H8U719_9SPHI|nr:hypothetical protein [Mucilaginibacter gossypiicola]SEO98847.1 hypothetical protein SAMN05192574_11847 [Mucilaginibacter gossypiicola]
MNDLPTISFNRFTSKHYFYLSPEICDTLSIPHHEGRGLTICHEQIQKLNEIRYSVCKMNKSIQVVRKGRTLKRWVHASIAVTLLLLAVAMVVANAFVLQYFLFLDAYYDMTVITFGITSGIFLFMTSFSSAQDVDVLRNALTIMEVRNHIETEFLCFESVGVRQQGADISESERFA